MNHAHPVFRSVCGPVSIKVHVPCLVLLLAIAFHATSVARNFFHVVINVLVYVVKSVQSTTVSNVVCRRTRYQI
jgi:hypothetical protein